MTRTRPQPAPPLQTPAPHQWEDVSFPTYDLTSNRPNTRLILSGIRFRTWKHLADILPLGHRGLGKRSKQPWCFSAKVPVLKHTFEILSIRHLKVNSPNVHETMTLNSSAS
ncbi:hypothetical protein AVEN_180016-1 [Araneus ventricosus]|uniref:Uncharacterized protein n=1 Tax=Araneus ventricosus TaxID=182803 RepID=A0A4Y2GWW5_ARAVE|nr:hypothetical protein AVEN_180016-1 [Araneus ventricosus]